jgi:hypothetical protein
MKIRACVYVAITAIGVCSPTQSNSKSCPPQKAQHVEETIQQIEAWSQFASFYSDYKNCDVSALRYSFTQQIAYLLVNDQGFSGLSKMLIKYPYLKPIILQHLGSEAISSDNRSEILKALQTCQSEQKEICMDIKKALDSQ